MTMGAGARATRALVVGAGARRALRDGAAGTVALAFGPSRTCSSPRRRTRPVPVSALLFGADGSASILLVRNERVEARRVTPSLSAEGFSEVRGDIAEGDAVVARAGSFLRDGDRVRPVPANTSTPIADAAPR